VAAYTLRLSVTSTELHRYQTELSLHEGDSEKLRACTEFSFELHGDDRELFRWYW
jgi:hypothetical protein